MLMAPSLMVALPMICAKRSRLPCPGIQVNRRSADHKDNAISWDGPSLRSARGYVVGATGKERTHDDDHNPRNVSGALGPPSAAYRRVRGVSCRVAGSAFRNVCKDCVSQIAGCRDPCIGSAAVAGGGEGADRRRELGARRDGEGGRGAVRHAAEPADGLAAEGEGRRACSAASRPGGLRSHLRAARGPRFAGRAAGGRHGRERHADRGRRRDPAS